MLLINMDSVGKEWAISGTKRRTGTEDFEEKKKLHSDAKENQSISLRQRREVKDIEPKHRDARLIYRKESLGEEDSQGETLARGIQLWEE